MRAVAVRAFGDTPELMELPDPRPAPDEVLVRLEAASVNPIDLRLAEGAFEGRMAHVFPLVLGVDGAGRVEAVGDRVRGLRPGDVVHGQFLRAPIGTGTFAGLVAVPELMENGAIQRAPDGLAVDVAAALPTAGMTAFGVVGACGPRAGQTVLSLGATGGVGVFAVQLAAARGAEVIATARPDADAWIRELGAGDTVDHTAGDVAKRVREARPGGVDLLLDLVGDQAAFAACAELVRDGGAALSVAFAATPDLLASSRITVANYGMRDKPDLLAAVTAEVAAGRITVPIQREIPLEQAPEALARNHAGGARGKTVVRI